MALRHKVQPSENMDWFAMGMPVQPVSTWPASPVQCRTPARSKSIISDEPPACGEIHEAACFVPRRRSNIDDRTKSQRALVLGTFGDCGFGTVSPRLENTRFGSLERLNSRVCILRSPWNCAALEEYPVGRLALRVVAVLESFHHV